MQETAVIRNWGSGLVVNVAKVNNGPHAVFECCKYHHSFVAKHSVVVDRSSPWGNPFVIGRDGDRAEVIEQYRQWLFKNPLRDAEVRYLYGKYLVCHCAPEPCHADVLLRYVNFHFAKLAQ